MVKIHFCSYSLFSHFVQFHLSVMMFLHRVGMMQFFPDVVPFSLLLLLLSMYNSHIVLTQIFRPLSLNLEFPFFGILILWKFILNFIMYHFFMISLKRTDLLLYINLRKIDGFHVLVHFLGVLFLTHFHSEIVIMLGFQNCIPNCGFYVHVLFKLCVSKDSFTHFFQIPRVWTCPIEIRHWRHSLSVWWGRLERASELWQLTKSSQRRNVRFVCASQSVYAIRLNLFHFWCLWALNTILYLFLGLFILKWPHSRVIQAWVSSEFADKTCMGFVHHWLSHMLVLFTYRVEHFVDFIGVLGSFHIRHENCTFGQKFPLKLTLVIFHFFCEAVSPRFANSNQIQNIWWPF